MSFKLLPKITLPEMPSNKPLMAYKLDIPIVKPESNLPLSEEISFPPSPQIGWTFDSGSMTRSINLNLIENRKIELFFGHIAPSYKEINFLDGFEVVIL